MTANRGKWLSTWTSFSAQPILGKHALFSIPLEACGTCRALPQRAASSQAANLR